MTEKRDFYDGRELRPLELEAISAEDREFITRIMAKYPQWAALAKMEQIKGVWYPTIRAEAPSGNQEMSLYFFSSDSEGPTYGVMSGWHSHLDARINNDIEIEFNQLWQWVDSVTSDRLVLIQDLGPNANPFSQFEFLCPLSSIEFDRPCKISSWSGRFDREYPGRRPVKSERGYRLRLPEMPFEPSKLSDEGRELAYWVFEKQPDWRKFATMIQGGQSWEPIIRVPAPAKGQQREMLFWIEPYVGLAFAFGGWTQWMRWRTPDGTRIADVSCRRENFEEAWKQVEEIQADKKVLLWDLSSNVTTTPDLVPIEKLKTLTFDHVYRALSWTGAQDVANDDWPD